MPGTLELHGEVQVPGFEASRKIPAVEILAYTGGFMDVPGYGQLCIDLGGLEAGPVAVLADHESRRNGVVGHGLASIEGDKLTVRGQDQRRQ